MSHVDLQLIADKDMYHFVQKSIHGGISMISTRYAQANNPSFPATCDASLHYLIYLDANNLYEWAMSQSLPTHGFCFFQQEEISALKLQDLSDVDEDGYILEVGLHYPTNLHNQDDDYPLAPESLVIDCSMYSPTQQKKLTPNLRDEVKYAVHYRNLKLYIQLRLVVTTKVHRVLAFKQLPWPKTYIDLNTRHHSLAGNSFLKDFFKLMNNSVLGKTRENLRNRVHVELVIDARLLRKRVANPNFCRGKPITDCLTVVQSKVH